ncbi:unnamed protein product, partial [Ascophyllum nodosum]
MPSLGKLFGESVVSPFHAVILMFSFTRTLCSPPSPLDQPYLVKYMKLWLAYGSGTLKRQLYPKRSVPGTRLMVANIRSTNHACERSHPFTTRFSLSTEMSRLTRDGTAEPVSRDQILRRERGQ